MFIGHFAVGFAAKKFAPKTSLGTLFISVQFLDLLWPILLLLNLEHVRIDPGNTVVTPLDFYDYPWSHSLLMVAIWSFCFTFAYFVIKRYRAGAIAVGLGVLSHWFLDLPMHRPDLPILPFTETKVGLGLWNSFAATVTLEAAVFIAGLTLYLKTTRSKDRVGQIGLAVLVFLLVGIWAANFAGPPPPSESAIAVAGHAQWLFVALAFWIDRHRAVGQSAA